MKYGLFEIGITGVIGSVETINEGTESAFSKMSVACNGAYTDKQGQKVETTDWVEVLLGKKANLANYSKGRKVLVKGVPKVNAYVNANGDIIGKQQIVGARVIFLDAKPGEGEATEETHQE